MANGGVVEAGAQRGHEHLVERLELDRHRPAQGRIAHAVLDAVARQRLVEDRIDQPVVGLGPHLVGVVGVQSEEHRQPREESVLAAEADLKLGLHGGLNCFSRTKIQHLNRC